MLMPFYLFCGGKRKPAAFECHPLHKKLSCLWEYEAAGVKIYPTVSIQDIGKTQSTRTIFFSLDI